MHKFPSHWSGRLWGDFGMPETWQLFVRKLQLIYSVRYTIGRAILQPACFVLNRYIRCTAWTWKSRSVTRELVPARLCLCSVCAKVVSHWAPPCFLLSFHFHFTTTCKSCNTLKQVVLIVFSWLQVRNTCLCKPSFPYRNHFFFVLVTNIRTKKRKRIFQRSISDVYLARNICAAKPVLHHKSPTEVQRSNVTTEISGSNTTEIYEHILFLQRIQM